MIIIIVVSTSSSFGAKYKVGRRKGVLMAWGQDSDFAP
jgi:hypothetical protein